MKPPDTLGFLSNSPIKNIRIRTTYPIEHIPNIQHIHSLYSLSNDLINLNKLDVVKSISLASVITLTTYLLKRLLFKPADSITAIGDELLNTLKIPIDKIELINNNKKRLLQYVLNKWTNSHPTFTLLELESFHRFIKRAFDPSPITISTIFQSLISETNDTNALCYLMTLHDSFVGNIKMYSAHLQSVFSEDVEKTLRNFKLKMYEEFVTEKLNEELARHASLFPPLPPPITGDESKVAERKRQLLSHLSTNSRFLLSLTDNEIEEAARKLAKCTWALDFYSNELSELKPYTGYTLLGLSDQEAIDVKKSCIIKQSEKIKNEVMNPLQKHLDSNSPCFVPKFKIIEQCRLDQIRDLSNEIADWQNLLKDTIERKLVKIPKDSDDFYSLDNVPAFKGEIKGGKAVKRPYLPPEHGEESLSYDELKDRMDESDYLMYDKDFNPKFEFTSREAIEAAMDEANKMLEPYKHMDPQEYLDMFIKNSNAEWKFTMATINRINRRKKLQQQQILEEEECEDEVKELDKTEYKLSKREILADALYFLSKLEHLKWCHSYAIHMPITALDTVKQVGKDPDNPPPPCIKFVGPTYKLPREWIKEYLSDTNTPSNIFRNILDSETEGLDDSNPKDIYHDNTPYVNDDPELLMKDIPLLAAIRITGGQTGVTCKFPDPLDGQEVYDRMQKFLPYRLFREKPSPQTSCINCGYTIFNLQFKDKSGVMVMPNEYMKFQKCGFKCPVCSCDKFNTNYPTGKIGLSQEAQEAIDDAYVFPEDYQNTKYS